MNSGRKVIVATTLIFCGALATLAQEPSSASLTATMSNGQQVTITEPSPVKVDALFRHADLVAVLRIASGDTEHYSTAIYKAVVLTPFKGARRGDVIFFGPFIDYRLGGEYLAFLRRDSTPPKETGKSESRGFTYGPLSTSYSVMYDGYSVLPIEYVCAFEKKAANEGCDLRGQAQPLSSNTAAQGKNLSGFC